MKTEVETTALQVIRQLMYYAKHSEDDWNKTRTASPALGEVYLDTSDDKSIDAFNKLQDIETNRAETRMICKYRKLSTALNKLLKKYDEGKEVWNNPVVLLPEIDINDPDEC